MRPAGYSFDNTYNPKHLICHKSCVQSKNSAPMGAIIFAGNMFNLQGM